MFQSIELRVKMVKKIWHLYPLASTPQAAQKLIINYISWTTNGGTLLRWHEAQELTLPKPVKLSVIQDLPLISKLIGYFNYTVVIFN